MKCPHCGKKINPAKMLGHLRAESMSKKERVASARNAARARWAKSKKEKSNGK